MEGIAAWNVTVLSYHLLEEPLARIDEVIQAENVNNCFSAFHTLVTVFK
jgi:hypothetical protein